MLDRSIHESRGCRQYTVIYATFATAISLIINAIIHAFYYHPRPFVTHHVHQLVAHTIDSSRMKKRRFRFLKWRFRLC